MGGRKKGSILAVEQIFELRIQIFCTCTSLVHLQMVLKLNVLAELIK